MSPDNGSLPGDTTRDSLTSSHSLYVASGENGNGSMLSPFGSIQQALDSAYVDSMIDTVLVAEGKYNESLRILGGVVLTGSRLRSANWLATSAITTAIQSNDSLGISAGILVEDVTDPVTIEGISVFKANASRAGSSSIALYFINCDSVTLNRCAIHGGSGAAGIDGLVGMAGVAGADAVMDWGANGPAPGGNGGAGGSGSVFAPGVAGIRGYCVGGIQEGGLPGNPIEDGQPGPTGIHGINGLGGDSNLTLVQVNGRQMLISSDGIDGTDAVDWGCGGGGAGGVSASPSVFPPYWNPGPPGGGGGAGGAPGTKGTGGRGGGNSIAVFLDNSNIVLYETLIRSQDGGIGGAGGNGGVGGSGGLGARPAWTQGGNGGNGGRGGHGGGGAGGWSIGCVLYMSSIQVLQHSQITTGQQGPGGQSLGHPGADGRSYDSLRVN